MSARSLGRSRRVPPRRTATVAGEFGIVAVLLLCTLVALVIAFGPQVHGAGGVGNLVVRSPS